jgi:hypothetical protein
MSITSTEARQIAAFISPIYRDHLKKYSFGVHLILVQ